MPMLKKHREKIAFLIESEKIVRIVDYNNKHTLYRHPDFYKANIDTPEQYLDMSLEDREGEIWMDTMIAEHVKVSNHGRVKTLDRILENGTLHKGRIMKVQMYNDTPRVQLTIDGVRYQTHPMCL